MGSAAPRRFCRNRFRPTSVQRYIGNSPQLLSSFFGKSWHAFPSSGLSLQPESKFANPLNSANNDITGKAAGNRRSIETFTRSKTTWNGSVAEPENQTGGPSWSEPPLLNNRVQSVEMTVRKDCSGNKPFSGKQGFGSWNKNGMGNYEEHKFQQKGWDATKTFDGGRGSGGRNGRGSGRGGRNQFVIRSYANAIKFEVFIVEG